MGSWEERAPEGEIGRGPLAVLIFCLRSERVGKEGAEIGSPLPASEQGWIFSRRLWQLEARGRGRSSADWRASGGRQALTKC